MNKERGILEQIIDLEADIFHYRTQAIALGLAGDLVETWDWSPFITAIVYPNETTTCANRAIFNSIIKSNASFVPFIIACAENVTPAYPTGQYRETVSTTSLVLSDNYFSASAPNKVEVSVPLFEREQ